MVILLRHWRDRRGYSVRELARRARVGYVTIVRIENGHMSPTVAMLRSWRRHWKSTRGILPATKEGKEAGMSWRDQAVEECFGGPIREGPKAQSES